MFKELQQPIENRLFAALPAENRRPDPSKNYPSTQKGN